MTAATGRRALPDTAWGQVHGSFRWLWCAVDVVAVLALLAGLAVVLWPVYGTTWLFVAVGGFGLAGALVAILSAWRGIPSVPTAVVAVGVWFLAGSPLVMPSAATAGFLPSMRTLWGLLTGPVTAWRDMLTLEPPIGETLNLLAVPGFLAYVGAMLAMLVSLRTRRPQLAWLPVAVAWGVAAALGAQVAVRPLVVGVALFFVILVWTSYRRSHLRAALATGQWTFRPLRVTFGALVLAAAVGITYVVMPFLAPTAPRLTVRQAVEPPINLQQFPSPLQGFRYNITDRQDDALLDVSGLGEGDILRIATLDRYNGMNFEVASSADEALEATTFTRVGEWIADDTPGNLREAIVSVRGYHDVWVPTLGKSTQVAFDGDRSLALAENFFYNKESGTGLSPVGLQEGDRYRVTFISASRPSDAEIRQFERGEYPLPESEGVPEVLRNRALEWTEGYGTDGEKALVLESALREGYFSHGQEDEVRSLPGHSAARLDTLLSEPDRMVGDAEQYATAMALMARDIGIPARVIYGYRGSGSPTVTGDDVAAWPELYFQGHGWVVFDPTPPKDRILQEHKLPPPPAPEPHIENPPPPPQDPEIPPDEEDMPIKPADPPDPDPGINWPAIVRWSLLIGLPLLTLVLPVALILGFKWRRRRMRRRDPIVANRWAGAWAELVDRARDVGRPPSPAGTRSEQAEEMMSLFGKIDPEIDPIGMSREADNVVFAPGQPREEQAEEYWSATGKIRHGMRRSVGSIKWFFSRLSVRSFRKKR